MWNWPYHPKFVTRALSYMVRSMVNIICSFWLGGSTEVSSIQWEMRAPPLCYRSCVSGGEWLVVAARALHHMTPIGPVAPKKHRCLGLLVVGLRAALCEPSSLGDYTHRRKRVCMA